MKAYMGYSRGAGSEEGAVLIFANNSIEAKKIGWVGNCLTDEYIDFAVRLIKDSPYVFKEKLKDTPHVIDNPRVCNRCELWGTGEIGSDGVCDACKELLNYIGE